MVAVVGMGRGGEGAKMLSETLDALKHLFWPTRCASCDVLLSDPSGTLCSGCRDSVSDAPQIDPPEYVDGMCALYVYDGAVKNMIARWKYHEDYSAQKAVLSFLPCQIRRLSDFVPQGSAVIPVPPHPKRLRERGFDPVWTFASKVCRVLSGAGRQVRFCDDVIVRTRHTPHQAGLDSESRAHNLDGAFQVVGNPESDVVVLVDDVVTTGATATACARALHDGCSGLERVLLLALAHPVGADDGGEPDV